MICTVELYRKLRLACADGMSKRAADRHFSVSRDSVDKILAFTVPHGFRRSAAIKRPKLDGYTEIIDTWLDRDRDVHRKQQHTEMRVFDRLREVEPWSRHQSEALGEGLQGRLNDHQGMRPQHATGPRAMANGSVVGLVGYARRNFMVPIPRFASWEAVNAYLEAQCRGRHNDILRSHKETIWTCHGFVAVV